MSDIFQKVWKVGDRTFGLLKVSEAKVSRWNIRTDLSIAEMEEIKQNLAPSIEKEGLLQIPVATSRGEIYIGGRRLEAVKFLNEPVILVEIRDEDPFTQLKRSWTENFRRKDSNRFWEEGAKFKEMLKLKKMSIRELARELGVSEYYVRSRVKIHERLSAIADRSLTIEEARYLAYADLPDKVLERFIDGLSSNKMSLDKVKRIVHITKTAKELLETTNDEIRKKLEKEFEDDFWTENLSLDYLNYRITQEEGGNIKLKTVRIEESYFKTEDEAKQFAKKCAGRYLGKKTFYVLEIDPYRYKQLKKDES